MPTKTWNLSEAFNIELSRLFHLLNAQDSLALILALVGSRAHQYK